MDTNEMQSIARIAWGVDLRPEDRPGVPRETEPRRLAGAHWVEPPQQPITSPILTRADLERPTPVFSTALPPNGMTGAIRAKAYEIPGHFVRHWALLLLADRIESLQNLPNWFFPTNTSTPKNPPRSAT